MPKGIKNWPKCREITASGHTGNSKNVFNYPPAVFASRHPGVKLGVASDALSEPGKHRSAAVVVKSGKVRIGLGRISEVSGVVGVDLVPKLFKTCPFVVLQSKYYSYLSTDVQIKPGTSSSMEKAS